MKNESQTTHASPSALKAFFLASRPKTWIASLSPVCIGSVIARDIHIPILILTLLFSLFIQIGTNFANDYFDFVNGADTVSRNGPKRATQQGWISPPSMLMATFLIFGTALLIAVPLMVLAGLWSLLLAATCVAFGLLYTGGPKPLGYLGLGELLVFIFFGPVATCGAYFLQTGTVDLAILIASLAPGLLSCAILIANNLRDEKTDKLAGKFTLIVRFGRTFGSWEYTLSILAAALIPILLVYFYNAPMKLLVASLILPLSLPSIRKAFTFRDPLEIIPILPATALLLFLYTILFCTALLC
jgi:1,4-dihydroxy-2-naphthoate octaprenyltransferase